MLTCRACGVDPLIWQRHVLAELPQRDDNADIGDLLPFNIQDLHDRIEPDAATDATRRSVWSRRQYASKCAYGVNG
jgi:hypothetical protein